MKNLKTFLKRVATVVVSSTLIASLTPVSGAFASMVSDNTSEIATEVATEDNLSGAVEVVSSNVLEEITVSASEAVQTAEEVTEVLAPTSEENLEQPAEVPAEESVVTEETAEQPEEVTEETSEVTEPTEEAIPTEVISEEAVGAEIISANTVSEDAAKASVSEDVISANEIDIRAMLATGLSAVEAEALSLPAFDGQNTIMSASTSTVKYYSQPSWYMNSGYDAVAVYITNDAGEYTQRCFWVTDGAEWLLYDYGEYAAMEFFSKTEYKDGKYIPVQKATSRKDNSKTAGIDESKIPTITEANYKAMVYDWRTLANVPFTRNSSGNLVYAGTGTEDDPVKPSPTPDDTMNQYTFTINNSRYDVYLTKSVVYNGKKHVLSTAKSTTKQSPDVTLIVYRNGDLVPSSKYTVKFANNTNANGYGKATAVPYVVINLKSVAPYKKDAKLMASNKFTFTILPADLSTLAFSVKKVRVTNGTKVALNTPRVKIGDVYVKLTPQSTKNPLTGTYVLSYADGKVTVTGCNNFYGNVTIDLLSAKTMDYVF